MKKRTPILVLLVIAISVALLLSGCDNTGDKEEEEPTQNTSSNAEEMAGQLIAGDSEIIDIFVNGRVDYNPDDTLEDKYYAVTDFRFLTLEELQAYGSAHYSAKGQEYIDGLKDREHFVERDGNLYVEMDFVDHDYPLPDLKEVTCREDKEKEQLTIAYKYDNGKQAQLIASKVDGAWCLDTSHGQILQAAGYFDPSREDGGEAGQSIKIYDAETNGYREEPLENAEDPKDVIHAVSASLGVNIALVDAYVEDNVIVVDFDPNSPPITGVGSTEEVVILNSIAKSLLTVFPEVSAVYVRSGGHEYISNYYEFGLTEPYVPQ